jgi:hypothetical protein
MNILPECQDEAFKILRHVKHVGRSINLHQYGHTHLQVGPNPGIISVPILSYITRCALFALNILLTEFGIRFFCRFGFRRTFDIQASRSFGLR